MTEAVCVSIEGPSTILQFIVICCQKGSSALNPGSGKRWNRFVFCKQSQQWLMVREYTEIVPIQVLVQFFYGKNQGQPFFFDMGIIPLGVRERS